MRVQITPMSLTDIPAIMEIENHSHLEPWSRESFTQELGRSFSQVLVARILDDPFRRPESPGDIIRLPGRVAGYLCYWHVADEIQILNVAVHRDCRGLGVARRLLRLALEVGVERGARLAVLEVRKSNMAARTLYESMGFCSVGERPDYYGVVKESAVFMELNLDEWTLSPGA